jgi:energy-coupling factor transporter ATP-binding protein EcfA2
LRNIFVEQIEDLLKSLLSASDAPLNSRAKQHESACLENTRIDLLQEIYYWADGQDERCIFWLNGLAGTGKSTIARTLACIYFERKRLGASFFFARGGGDVGNAGKFVTSIAIQLASSVSAVRQHVSNTVSEYSDITSLSFRDQWQMLILTRLPRKLNV